MNSYTQGSQRFLWACQLPYIYTWKYENDDAVGRRPHLINTRWHHHETTGILECSKKPTRVKRLKGIKSLMGPAWPSLTPGLSIQGNILYLTTHSNQGNSYKERILQKTCINEDLLYKEKTFPTKKRRSSLFYYKNPKALTNQRYT